ncbi:MAG: nitrite/sulfite reductase [candidate division FCPU426 bacterium]
MSPVGTSPISEAIKNEISNYQDKVQGYRAGQVPDEEFKPFRLLHGVYGQRQQDVQMMRIKIPGGQMNAVQVKRLGDVARIFAPLGIGHVTTRQCFQYHYVKLENTSKVMDALAEVGITTREACGNSVRNITSSVVAGIAGDEVFDPYPYAYATFQHLVRRPEFANLPRKFKMAFNGGIRDYAQGSINDVGFYAETRIVDGKVVRGFKVKVGGGLGASPQDAWLYSEFTPVDEILPMLEAILTHFNEKGERKNRMAARIKFLIRREGIETFKAEVAKIRATLPKTIPIDLPAPAADPQGTPGAQAPATGPGQYKEWLRLNTWPQKQKGFRYAVIKLTLGDLTHQQFHILADLMGRYGNDNLRTSNDQNLILTWVREEKLAELYAELEKADLADLGPDLIGDVTSCPGADTCNLGLTSSRGLGAKLSEMLAFGKDENKDLEGTHVKISGCPNSCGQHHVATFGFFGNVRKVNGQDSPHFQMLIGGGIDDQAATFGRVIGRVPARRVPAAVKLFVDKFRMEKSGPTDTLEAWLRRMSLDEARKLIEPVCEITSGDPELLKDNGSEENFVFEGLGASECA